MRVDAKSSFFADGHGCYVPFFGPGTKEANDEANFIHIINEEFSEIV